MLLNNKKCSNCNGYYDPTLFECPECHKRNELYDDKAFPTKVVFFHPVAQIGLFVCGFAYIGMLISELIASLFVGFISQDELLQNALVLLLTYLMMYVGLMAIALSTRRDTFYNRFKRPFDYLIGLGYSGLIVGGALVVSLIVSFFYDGANNANQSAAIEISKNYPILAAFVLCVLGPICEEMTYRVGLYSFLRRINKYLAMIVTILVFALIHFDFFADDLINELWSLPTYLICGFILTLAYERHGPACSMTAHLFYNIFAFVMILLA